MKLIWKICLWIIGVIIGLGVVGVVAFQVSPYPNAWVIRQMFNKPVDIQDQTKYASAKEQRTLQKDLSYPSAYQNHTFDVYQPKQLEGKVPVLIWAHGGGFVGGDKSGVKEFATYVAADSKMIVIAMNYQVAPDLAYPGQVKQMGELIHYLQTSQNQAEYATHIDWDKVFVGGDSAGAQIAGQYAVIQTNNDYAKAHQFQQTLTKNQLRGFISYSGPVHLKQVKDKPATSRAMKWFVNSVGWSLVGTKQWQTTPELQAASLVDHLTGDFPPTYITDGNAFSFADEGLALQKRLNELHVPVTGLFYEETKKEITHEYQFNYKTKEAQQAYQETTAFIAQQR